MFSKFVSIIFSEQFFFRKMDSETLDRVHFSPVFLKENVFRIDFWLTCFFVMIGVRSNLYEVNGLDH